MKRTEIAGIVVLAIGILYAGFWGCAQRDVNSTMRVYRFSEMPKEQFVRQFPFLNLAFSFFNFDLYAPSKEDRQIPESWFALQGIKRHLWFGIALVMFGGAVVTFKKTWWFTQGIHYCCVVGFGAALFAAATLHPIVRFWHGK